MQKNYLTPIHGTTQTKIQNHGIRSNRKHKSLSYTHHCLSDNLQENDMYLEYYC
jgi:hypothetical protein